MSTADSVIPKAKRRWRLRGRFPDGELEDCGYPPLIRHLLWHRGVRSAEEAAAFLEGGPPAHDPLLLPDAPIAVRRLAQAASRGETVAIYGDYDVDGITACAILAEGLQDLGANVVTYLPDRFSEGYGLNSDAVAALARQGVTLLVTADCGTSSIREIGQARQLGMDVVVVDHHSVGGPLPPALALVNPKRADNRYPDSELTSGGLALRLMSAIYASMGVEWRADRFLDLAALSTVCDVAPLRGENRWLVKEGLRVIARGGRPGLRALVDAAGLDPLRVDARAIGYMLGPRLNAAGRLAHARLALDLLLEKDEAAAAGMALALSALNRQRQQATVEAVELAMGLMSREDPRAPLVFIGHPEISSGIMGLVAGRLAEELYKPAVVYQEGPVTSVGSCRSIPEFDISAALRRCSHLMLRFGGHRAAAGFTADNSALPELKAALLTEAQRELAGLELAPVVDIDAQIPLHMVGATLQRGPERSLLAWLARLAPFGEGNPEPVFLSRGLEVMEAKRVGAPSSPAEGDGAGAHLRLKLRDPEGLGLRAIWPAIAFGRGADGITEGDRLDVVYSFSGDNMTGAAELRVIDLAPATQRRLA